MKFAVGHDVSPETRAKIAASLRGKPGRPHTPEAKAKIAASKANISVDTRAKLSAAGRLRVVSDATRSKWAAQRKGRPVSAATHAAALAATKGRKQSPEHIAKRSAAQRLAWANGRKVVPHGQRYTTLAQSLHAHLSLTGLTLEPEVRFGRFTVDLYDREHHVAYEADGKYWHDKHEAKHPGFAAARDEYLIQYFGLKVVHFTDKEIKALTGWPYKKAVVA